MTIEELKILKYMVSRKAFTEESAITRDEIMEHFSATMDHETIWASLYSLIYEKHMIKEFGPAPSVKLYLLKKPSKLSLIKAKPDFCQEVNKVYQEKKSRAAWLIANEIMENVPIVTLWDTKEMFYYDAGVYRPGAERLISEFTQEVLDCDATTHFVSEVIGHVERSTYMERSIFDINPFFIALDNGVLDIKNMIIHKHSPKFYFLFKLPIKYNSHADCPKFKQFLKEILWPEDIPVVQELFGYCLYRRYNIHKAFLFYGDGANGKSTLLNVLRTFLGVHNVASVSMQNLDSRFTLSTLYGKLANIYADLPRKAMYSTGMFKMLTGEDLIMTDVKFKNPFSFLNTAKMIFSCNQVPESMDESFAYFRRWILINFPNKFVGERADPNIHEKLTTEQEMSGILNWAIDGLKRLLARGDFSYGRSTQEVWELYEKLSSPVAAFVRECLEFESTAWITKDELYNKFVKYCEKNKLATVEKNVFGRKLPRYLSGVSSGQRTVEGKKGVTVWIGVKLKEQKEKPEKQVGLGMFVNELEQYIVRIINGLEQKHGECNTEDLLNCFPSEDREVVEKCLVKMKEKGIIFELRPGILKVL